MATKWFKKFIDKLKEILGHPPYLIFIFISAVFVIITLITKNNFNKVWIFFLYSAAGMIWRYIEKDIDGGLKKVIEEEKNKNISHLIIITIYHIGNISLFFVLLYYLKLL